MTIQQFHREFKIALDKVDSSSYPEFLDGEIDYYLNEAQDRFIKTRYGGNNLYRARFEEIQKRTDDLKELVVSNFALVSLATSYSSVGQNVYMADLSKLYTTIELDQLSGNSYMIYVKSLSSIKIDDCVKFVPNKLVQHDDINTLINDPFNKPNLTKNLIFFENGNIFIWATPEVTVESLFVTFIKRPAQMNIGTYGNPIVECELSEYTHKEIVQLAVSIAIENIESPRVETQEPINISKIE